MFYWEKNFEKILEKYYCLVQILFKLIQIPGASMIRGLGSTHVSPLSQVLISTISEPPQCPPSRLIKDLATVGVDNSSLDTIETKAINRPKHIITLNIFSQELNVKNFFYN